jgi:glycosyltransferase involved in cell wall biosynthesis
VLFSVVVPCFNRLAYLPQALSSVWAQTFTDYEVIVVDDGSTDGTAEYLSTLDARVRVVRQENAGPGAARNAGTAAAAGEYLAFLDSDDLWFPWTLSVLAGVIRSQARPALIAGCVTQFAGSAPAEDQPELPLQVSAFRDFLASAPQAILIGSGTIAVRRDVAVASGGFVDRRINGEDLDFLLRLGVATGFVHILAPVTLAWRRHPESATHVLAGSIDGADFLIRREHEGHYPGSDTRAAERREVITRLVRPVSFACVRADALRAGLYLYRTTFAWHVQLGRWAYLAGFPLIAAWASARSLIQGARPS